MKLSVLVWWQRDMNLYMYLKCIILDSELGDGRAKEITFIKL